MQPSTLTWINPAGGDWSNPANWKEQGTNTNRLPGEGDDAIVDLGDNDFTVTHLAGTDTVNSLICQSALNMSGGTLTFGSDSHILGSFTFTGGFVAASELVINGTTIVVGSDADDMFAIGPDGGLTWTDDAANHGTIYAFGPLQVFAQNGDDQLSDSGWPNYWQLTGTNSGIINDWVSFEGIDQLIGGELWDTFQIDPGVSFAGSIDGGDGFDFIDYSAITGQLTIDRNSLALPYLGNYSEIEGVRATQSSEDTLIGPNGSASWTTPGNMFDSEFGGMGNVDGFYFDGFENLIGGSGFNTLINGAGFAYQALPPVYYAESDDHWEITGADAGTLNDSIYFENMDSLIGGPGKDTFHFQSGGSINGLIDGGELNNGPNIVDYSDVAGPLTIHVQNLSRFYAVIASPSSLLVGPDTDTDWLLGWHGCYVNGMRFNGFERLVGGGGTDTFGVEVGYWSYFANVASIDGGAGENRLWFAQWEDIFDLTPGIVIDLHDPSQGSISYTYFNEYPIISSFQNITAIDPIPYLINTIIGPDAGAQWTVNNSGTVSIAGVDVTGVRNLFGGMGADQFIVNGTRQEGLFINGKDGSDSYEITFEHLAGPLTVQDDGSSSDLDSLIVHGTSLGDDIPITGPLVQWRYKDDAEFTGDNYREQISFSGIEEATADGGDGDDILSDPGSANLNLLGGTGDDTIIIADSTGPVAANGESGNNTIIILMGNLAGLITVNGNGGTNNVIVFAPSGSNVLNLSATQLTGAGETINLNLGSTIALLTVDGSAGQNSLTYEGFPPAPVTPINISVISTQESTIQGLVYVDFNNDGEVDFGEKAVAGVTLTLTGTDDLGNAIYRTTQTDAQGIYSFNYLRPSNAAGYTVTETQPTNYQDGLETLGTIDGNSVGSASANDVFYGIVLYGGSVATDYNFGDRPMTTGGVISAQTATIGFWQNKNGQNLIKALNGGSTAMQLGNWLAATFPNIYGELTGMTNAQIAGFYKTLFARTGQSSPGGPPKLDAQVMATALATYVTNQSLAGTTASAFGFLVTQYGVGAATFNVGSNGAAFGFANNSNVSIMDMLLAVNDRSHNGILFDIDGSGSISSLEAAFRTMANAVFSAINESGGV